MLGMQVLQVASREAEVAVGCNHFVSGLVGDGFRLVAEREQRRQLCLFVC